MNKSSHQQMVTDLMKPGQDILDSLTPAKCEIIHMVMGISGEAGELLDAIKKFVMYNKVIDMDHVIEEMGDLEFFLEGARQILGISREAILYANEQKLLHGEKARYKSGKYSDKQAHDRTDKQ